MLTKPPFILYSKISSPPKLKSKSQENYRNNINSIFSRVPESVIRQKPEIEKIIYPEPKVVFDVINNDKKPKKIELSNKMREPLKKRITNLNSFREILYNYNLEGKAHLKNFSDIKEENDKFSNLYKKIEKDKNKFNTGTYLDHEYLIGIANHYAQRGIKIPKISVDRNVFSGNPLILEGSELENYIVYNLGDRQKSEQYLNKLESIVRKKETGNYIISEEERKKLEYFEKNEKPKGYIDPDILIPKLKNDINKTKFTYDNIESFEKFFENKKKLNININNIDINSNIKSLNIPKINKNRSFNNLFEKINNTNNNKIIIKKKLSFINKKNNNISIINTNNNTNINNKYSSLSTRDYFSQIGSSENSPRILSPKDNTIISNSNISSSKRRKRTRLFQFSHLPSPIYRNNINISIFNNLFNEKNSNNNNIYSKDKIDNILNKNYRIFSVNNINKVKKRRLIPLRNNSVDNFKLRHSKLSKDSYIFNNYKKVYNNNSISYEKMRETEEYELNLLNKELEGIKKNDNKKDINLNVLDNNFDKKQKNNNNTIIDNNNENNNKENNNIEKTNIIKSNDINDKNIDKKEEKSTKIEKLFNSIVDNGYKSYRVKGEITRFLKSKGYDILKKLTIKDAYININKMKRKLNDRNYLLEEYKIRGREFSKGYLSPKQRIILDKNELLSKIIEDNEYKYKKLIIEKNFDKTNIDYNE